MQNNECSYISEQFTEYQENSLSPEIRARVDAHLTVCSACHTRFKNLGQILDQLHNSPHKKAKPDFTQNLMLQIEEMNQETFWHKLYSSSYTRIAGSAVAAGLLVALGLNIWIDPISPFSPQSERSFTGVQEAQLKPVESIVGQLDSTQENKSDSLGLNKTTIKSGSSSLQLVNDTK